MPLADSVDKIVTVYLASVCSHAFVYKGRLYRPKPLRVSPLIFRGFTCPQGCGGCCPRFTLDYLPSEQRPYRLERREVEIDGRAVEVYTDTQAENREHFCRNLDRVTGRCGIHGRHPFSCDFELIRFINFAERVDLNQKLFGRGWAMRRIDGGRGSLCEMLPSDESTVREVVRKLRRLREWADHFGVRTRLAEIIQWAEAGPRNDPLELDIPAGDDGRGVGAAPADVAPWATGVS